MKKLVFLLVLVLSQSLVCHAQERIEQAFGAINGNSKVNVLASSAYNETCADGKPAYCKFTEFVIPKKRKTMFENLEFAMSGTNDKSYDTFIQKEGGGSSRKVQSYLYGVNNEYSVRLGGHSSHNYYAKCFADPVDSLRRHAYIFVWFKDSGAYHCYFYHIYGLRPVNGVAAASAVNGTLKYKTDNAGRTRTETYMGGDYVVTMTYDSDGNLVRSRSVQQPSQASAEVKTDIDFMLQFGNLRAAFLDAIKDAEAKTLQTGIAVKIVRLCKEHAGVLSNNEKLTCVTSLNEMTATLHKTNADSFIDGLFREAKNVLTQK